MRKKGLSNPAVVATVLSSPQGQKAIANSQDAARKGISTGITFLKILAVGGLLTLLYYKVLKGFSRLSEDTRYKPSNINVTQARARAEAIYTALLGFGANYNTVENNLTGLNHNGFIRVYNEFGERRSTTLVKMNLVEWLQDQFKEDDIAKLRFLIKGFF
ncbi:hypothetical protein [Flavobacterium sp. ABG]|uniref:hypothetical protein n=1 Tax=Flavobacterium sp. ABG TaxID=1423322 RepID=UPI00064B648B|nr:hypothetical protein [Flavobacterium sp. ABG]KLT67930.1 hypothetical protein AB674_20075 [Flavobacterium sp. ABG]